ncbi:MAG TPA: sigma-70 family RNA polymerase sigma factor [Stellaceae bacterium]|nr:sigma-70 family RNA polymerase sigma factor [Stellaceae bacterium]
MYAAFAEPFGAGALLHHAAALDGRCPMTVPRADAAAVPPVFARLMQAVVERRDQVAFMTLFDHYAPRVKAYLKRLGAGDGIAEDLAQEVMLTVWRKAGTYDPAKAGVGTWIFTIARNLRIDALRRDHRLELDPADPLLAPDPAPLPDRQVEASREEEQVRSALRALPEDQARVITMAFYDGKSHGEIAAELALPLGTVKSRLRLAFRRVRGILGEVR